MTRALKRRALDGDFLPDAVFPPFNDTVLQAILQSDTDIDTKRKLLLPYICSNPSCPTSTLDVCSNRKRENRLLEHHNRLGRQPLHDAVGQPSVLALLLSHGAPVSGMKHGTRTALMLSAAKGCLQSTTCLLECGADVALRDGKGFTAFQIACQRAQNYAVALEIARQCPKEVLFGKAGNGRSPLFSAVASGNSGIVGYLLERAEEGSLDWSEHGLSVLDNIPDGCTEIKNIIMRGERKFRKH